LFESFELGLPRLERLAICIKKGVQLHLDASRFASLRTLNHLTAQRMPIADLCSFIFHCPALRHLEFEFDSADFSYTGEVPKLTTLCSMTMGLRATPHGYLQTLLSFAATFPYIQGIEIDAMGIEIDRAQSINEEIAAAWSKFSPKAKHLNDMIVSTDSGQQWIVAGGTLLPKPIHYPCFYPIDKFVP
jgi:hypothetical protein